MAWNGDGGGGCPAAGTAKKRRDQATRATSRKVGWLTSLVQSATAHHTAVPKKVDSDVEMLQARVIDLEKTIRLLQAHVQTLMGRASEPFIHSGLPTEAPKGGRPDLPGGAQQESAGNRDNEVARSTPLQRIDETTAQSSTEPEVAMDSAMDTESIPSFSPTDAEDGISEVPASMPATPTSSCSGARTRRRGKKPKKDDGEYCYEK